MLGRAARLPALCRLSLPLLLFVDQIVESVNRHLVHLHLAAAAGRPTKKTPKNTAKNEILLIHLYTIVIINFALHIVLTST
jgi:hypothetical protein